VIVGTRYRLGWRGLFLGAITAAVLGCGTSTRYPVKGTVSLDGQPATELAGGTVTFNSSELRQSVSAAIRADGTYELTAVPGNYQVTVSPPEAAPAGERGPRKVPTVKAVRFEQGKLEVTVERGGNDFPIPLHRR
jgi:hypothetical protein